MTEKIELKASPINLRISKGESTETSLTLLNRGPTVDQFTISVEGVSPDWYTLPVSSVALFPNDQDKVKILFHLPGEIDLKDTAYFIKVKVISQENPADFSTIELNLQIDLTPNLTLALSPPRLSGNKGRFQVTITNPDTREANLVLKADSQERRLRFKVQPETLTVPAGKKVEAVVEARLNWVAPLLPEKTYGFRISVEPVAGFLKTPVIENGELTSVRLFSKLHFPGTSQLPVIKTFNATTENKREFHLKWQVLRVKSVQLDGEDVEAQGEITVHPAEARQYVLKATNLQGSVKKTVEVKPLATPQTRVSDKIKVVLSSTLLQMPAGQAPSLLGVQVQNLSDIVDKYSVEVDGLEASWYNRSASSIALMPRTTEQIQISFLPPKKKGVKAGKYPFAVTVRSQSTSKESSSAVGQLEILPAVDVRMKIAPYRKTAMNKGTYRVQLSNTNVSDATVVLEATDLDEGCRFQFKQEKLLLGAWTSLDVPMVVRPKRGSFVGEVKRYDCTVTASVEDSTIPLNANCEFNHKPFMKDFSVFWRIFKILIILAIIVVALYYILQLGGGWEAFRADPQAWFQKAIDTVMRFFTR